MPEPPHLASSTAGVSALLRVLPERLTLSLRESPAATTHCAFKPLRPQSFSMICRSCLIGDFLVKVTGDIVGYESWPHNNNTHSRVCRKV